MLYTNKAVGRHAAIAQSVERILGKDEVASSNLASSSKRTSIPSGIGVLFLFERKTGNLIPCAKRRINREVVRISAKSKISWKPVASSNLASSSKRTSIPSGIGVLFLFERKTGNLIPCAKRRINREVVRISAKSKISWKPVASSNLASSSKRTSIPSGIGVLFLREKLATSSLTDEFQ